MSTRETIVLSFGGSLIVPNGGIDTQFLKGFSTFIRKQIAEKNRRFFIICGGGATARNYIDAGSKVVGDSISNEDKDWLGIHSTRLNAHLLRTIFQDIAYPRIFKHYDQEYDIQDEPVVVCSGWKPGWSTDYCAVLIAEQQSAKTILNLSNIDKVYDKDPRRFKDARPIEKTTWDHFETLVGDKWVPGLNAPFDPVATQRAKQLELTVFILNGRNISNLEAAIDGRRFIGTVITPFTLDASFYDREYYQVGKGIYAHNLFRLFEKPVAFLRALMVKLFIKPEKVLDIGCGLGYFVHYLRLLGIEAHGVEISEYALREAIPQVRSYIKKGDIRKLPYKDDAFDLVTTFNVLEHVHPDDVRQALVECKRVSRKYQLHKIFTKNNLLRQKLHGTDLSLVSFFDAEWWQKIFTQERLKPTLLPRPSLPHEFTSTFLLTE